jgi:hypothetical protein
MPDEQSRKELEIFSFFAEVCPLAIQPDSIEKRTPPEPDILCGTNREGPVAFEMIESIDPEFARQVTDIELQSLLHDAYQRLPMNVRSDLENRLGNARVTVIFHPEVSKQRRKNTIPIILESLQQVSPSFIGIHPSKAGLSKVVEGVIVVRGNSSGGPHFDQPPSGWLDDPMLDLVKQKFGKSYASSAPIELLVHYELPPVSSDQLWPKLHAFLEQHLTNSRFRRVWVFDVKNRTISFVYPEELQTNRGGCIRKFLRLSSGLWKRWKGQSPWLSRKINRSG